MRANDHNRNGNVEDGQAGSVFIIVLWACLGLVSMTLLYGHATTFSLRAADNDLAGRQADQAIEGASRYVMYLLYNLEVPGQLPLPEDYAVERVPVDEASFWFIGRTDNETALTEPIFDLVDEAGKLNLNTATREMLEALPGMPVELAAAIIDWRDEDDELTEGGAESETYLLGDSAYECKNAPFETVEELRLVYGSDVEAFYGDDANRNGVRDPHETNLGTGYIRGIQDFLTVHSREPNTRDDGTPRIHVQQGAEERNELFTETFGEERGSEIQQQLSAGPQNYGSLTEFFARSGMTEEEFEQVAAQLTVSEEPFLEGLVNVNSASQAVLACLPGLDDETARKLVVDRLSRNTPVTSTAWIVEAIGEEAALEAGPYLTGRTFQVSADIAAVGRNGRGYRRSLFIIDSSEETPVIRYRQDLSGLGWALGTSVFEQLRDDG